MPLRVQNRSMHMHTLAGSWSVVFIFLLNLASPIAWAQNARVGELRRALQEHPERDSVRVDLLNQLGELHPYVTDQERADLSREAIELSRKLNYPRGEITALLIGGRIPIYTGHRKLALPMFNRADSLARILDDPLLLYKVAYNQSLAFSEVENKRALRWALRADSQAHRLMDPYIISKAQFRLSELYTILNDYANALEYATRSEESATLANCRECQAQCMGRIGNIYAQLGNYEMATEYYERQREAYDQMKSGRGEYGWLYNNVGDSYFRLKQDYRKAIEYYFKALTTDSSRSRREVTIINLADVYLTIDSVDLALKYSLEGNHLAIQSEDLYLQAFAEEVLSRVYVKRNMLDSAIYFAERGFVKARTISNLENASKTALVMANAYSFKNDFKNAFRFMNLYVTYRDSILGKQTQNKISIIERANELKESETKIELLSQQKRSQQILIVAISVILALVIVASISLFRSNREKTRYSHERQLLISTVQAQEDERKRIAQDLHDELGAVLAIARMHIVQIQEEAGEVDLVNGLQQARLLTESALATMRRISYELMPQQLEEFGLVRTLQAIARQTNEAKRINIELTAEADLPRWSKAVERGLYRICMELINNTIKHAGARNIHIRLTENDNQILMLYTDDGKGLADNFIAGHGFRNMEARAHALGGSVRFGKREGGGFDAQVLIPS